MLAHTREVAPYFQAQLKTLEELPLVGEVRGMGLMACVECVADRDSKDPLRARQECRQAHRRALPGARSAGAAADQHVRDVAAARSSRASQIDDMVGILREGISRTMDDLSKEGVWQG